jgi:hypothetical protein
LNFTATSQIIPLLCGETANGIGNVVDLYIVLGIIISEMDNPSNEKEPPRGVPTLSYVRVLDALSNNTNAKVDIEVDEAFVTVTESGMV